MASKQIILNHVWKQGFAKGNRGETNLNWIDWVFFVFRKMFRLCDVIKKTTKNKKKEFQLSVPLTEAIRSKCELLSPQLLVNLCEF